MIDTSTPERCSRHTDCFVPAHTLPQRLSPPNLRAEAAAICESSKALAEDPGAAVRYLLDVAQDLCGAGSSGLSLVHVNQTGETTIRWDTVSGVLSTHETTDLPRDRSPCGLCLDTGIAIVISWPQRVFHQLADKSPSIAELLTVPLYDGGQKPLGTLWPCRREQVLRRRCAMPYWIALPACTSWQWFTSRCTRAPTAHSTYSCHNSCNRSGARLWNRSVAHTRT